MMPDEPTALFPLKTVLFPGGVLPLRIFEPRYVDMVGRCLKRRQNFGVLLIVEGAEVGGPARTAEVGTLAEIVDWHLESDGLLGIVAAGRERFRLKGSSLLSDGLYVGQIERLADEARRQLPDRYLNLAKLLRQVLPRLGAHAANEDERYDDASWVGYRLAEVLPLTLEDRQACLEMEDPVARLERLSASLN
jgi:uncharacterized protein